MILNYISFFIGCILLFFLPIVINKSKSGEKLNKYFFAIIAIAGIQRIIFGLINFGFINDFQTNLKSNLILGFMIPPIYLIFASNLFYQPTTNKKEITIFSTSALIVFILSLIHI